VSTTTQQCFFALEPAQEFSDSLIFAGWDLTETSADLENDNSSDDEEFEHA
jgi:hypothetical protein